MKTEKINWIDQHLFKKNTTTIGNRRSQKNETMIAIIQKCKRTKQERAIKVISSVSSSVNFSVKQIC